MMNSNGLVSDNRGSIQKINNVDTKQQKTKTNSGGIVGKVTAIFNNSRSRKNSRDDSSTSSPSANNKNDHLKDLMSKSFNEKIEWNGEINNNKNFKSGNSTLSNTSLYDYDKPTSVSEFLARHSASMTRSKEIHETSSTLTNGTLTDDDTSYCSAISNSLISNNLTNLPSTTNLVKVKNESKTNGFYEKNDLVKSTYDIFSDSELLNLKDNTNNSTIVTLTLPKKNSADNNLTKQNETGIF